MRPSLVLALSMVLCGLSVPAESKLRRQKSLSRRKERGLQDNTSLESFFSISFLASGSGPVDLNLAAQTLAVTYNNLAATSFSDPFERRMVTVEVLEVESRRKLGDDEIRNLQTTQTRNLNVFLRVTGTCRGCASRTRFTNQVQRRRRHLKSSSKSAKGKGEASTKGKGGQVDNLSTTARYDGSVNTVPSFNGYPVVSGNSDIYTVENAGSTQVPIQQPPGSFYGQPVYNPIPAPVSSGTLMPTASAMGIVTPIPIPPLEGSVTPLPIPPLVDSTTPPLVGTDTTMPIPPLVATVAPIPVPPLAGAVTPMPVPPLAATVTPMPVPPLAASVTPMPSPPPATSTTPMPTTMARGGQFSLTGGQSSTDPPLILEYPSSTPSGHPSSAPSLLPSTQPSSMPSSMPSTQPSSTPSSIPSMQPSSSPSALPTNLFRMDGQAGAEGSATIVYQPIQTADPGVVAPIQTVNPGVAAVPTEEEFRVAYAQELRRVECHILDVTRLEEVCP